MNIEIDAAKVRGLAKLKGRQISSQEAEAFLLLYSEILRDRINATVSTFVAERLAK